MSAKLFNEQNRSMQTATGVAPGLEKRQIGKSVSVSQKEDTRAPQFGVELKKAKITAIGEDYLDCVIYNERTETATATVVYVAKDREFRPSLYHAATITYPNGDVIEYTKDATNPQWKRQADNGVTSVDQIVMPCWYIGQVIKIVSCATSAVTDPDGFTINYEEAAFRQWAVI